MADPDSQGPIYRVPARNINAKTTTPAQFATWAPVSEGPIVRWSVLILRLTMFTFALVALIFNIIGTAVGLKAMVLAWITAVLCLLINGYELVCFVLAVWRPHRTWFITPMRIPATLSFDICLVVISWITLALKWNEFVKFDRPRTAQEYYDANYRNESHVHEFSEWDEVGKFWVYTDKAISDFHHKQELMRNYGRQLIIAFFLLAVGHAVLVVAECIACGVYCRRQRNKSVKKQGEAVELEATYVPKDGQP